ncbi:unnamed protein product [Phyllotreta striolata]|uniref:Uncharacterized protein n=1 Tax=Phyllotreta striolata TaxID=444603 RepID=A0A9P0GL37_PHYSR|nr:unnamed protein product [Phyllotreta striolata]
MNFSADVLTNIIINTYFLSTRCIIIFTDRPSGFNHAFPIPVVQINAENSDVRPEIFLNRFGCQGIVIDHRQPLAVFQRFEWEIRRSLERFNRRKFLVSSGAKNAMSVFDSEELNFVADLVVVESEEDSCKLWTHRYVGVDGNSQKRLLDVWFPRNRSFLRGADLYPNKLVDQMGRSLKLATFQYEPSSVIDIENQVFKGSELSTMCEFARHFNMTPGLVINSEDFWGSIYENWTGNGLIGNILYDKADFGFDGLYAWEDHYHYLDLSSPFIRTGITCLCPAPRLADGWLTPIYSFSKKMWCFVASAFFSSICAHFFLFYAKTNVLDSRFVRSTAYKTSQNLIFSIDIQFI